MYDYFQDEYSKYVVDIKLTNSKLDDLNVSRNAKDKLPQFHQAGYDSYITGVCFRVLKRLVEKGSKSIYDDDVRFKNKFYNAWSFDVPYLTTEKDGQTDRSNVYFIRFDCEPGELKSKLDKAFDDFKIDFLSDETVLVAIPEKTKHKFNLINSTNSLKIVPYNDYKKQKDQSISSNQSPKVKKIKIENVIDHRNRVDRVDEQSNNIIKSSQIEEIFTENNDWCATS